MIKTLTEKKVLRLIEKALRGIGTNLHCFKRWPKWRREQSLAGNYANMLLTMLHYASKKR